METNPNRILPAPAPLYLMPLSDLCGPSLGGYQMEQIRGWARNGGVGASDAENARRIQTLAQIVVRATGQPVKASCHACGSSDVSGDEVTQMRRGDVFAYQGCACNRCGSTWTLKWMAVEVEDACVSDAGEAAIRRDAEDAEAEARIKDAKMDRRGM